MATKGDLVYKVSKHFSYLPEEDINDAVNLVLGYLTEQLVKQNRIEIRGFGSFSIRQRKKVGSDNIYNTIYYRASQKTYKAD